MYHSLKLNEKYFNDVVNEIKSFELRKNDRNYKIGDILCLVEYSNDRGALGRTCERKIIYILENCEEFGLMKGYCILGLSKI